MRLIVGCIVGIIAGLAVSAASADVIIHAGRLIDGKAGSVAEEVSVVVRGPEIVAVQPGYRSGGAEPNSGNHTTLEQQHRSGKHHY